MITRSKTVRQLRSRSGEASNQNDGKVRAKRRHAAGDSSSVFSNRPSSHKRLAHRDGRKAKKLVVLSEKTSSGNSKDTLSSSRILQSKKLKEPITDSLKPPLAANQSLLSMQNILKLQAMKQGFSKEKSQSHGKQIIPPRKLRSRTQILEPEHSLVQEVQVDLSQEISKPVIRSYPRVEITLTSSREFMTSNPEVNRSTPEKYDMHMIEQSTLSDVCMSKDSEQKAQSSHSGSSGLLITQALHPPPTRERESSVRSTESTESIDQGFEEDMRSPDPERRMLVTTAHRFSSSPYNSSPPKRASHHFLTGCDDFPGFCEIEEKTTTPTMSEISSVARQITAQSRMALSGVQIRIPWSSNDEQLLLAGIEKYGCSWSSLSNILQGWDKKRDQVALKDKARNMKVSYLKAGVPLPKNFEKVRLGKKEIASVRAVIPDYDPDG